MAPEQVYIYALCDETGARYIGRTLDPAPRLVQHLALRDGGGRKRDWLAALAARGVQPELRILEVSDARHAPARERELIARHRAAGVDLTNGHPGCRMMQPRGKTEDVRVILSLPPEIATALKARAKHEATPVSVLVRRWIVEELRRGQGHG